MESGERKRIRVSQACDQCRRRKDRCDSGRPKCKPCCKAGRSCTYNPSTKKRGLPTGYVRAIETLLGLVFCSIDGYDATLQKLLRGELENADSRCSAAITGRDSAASDVFLDTWRKSSVMKEVDRLLTAVETSDIEGIIHEQIDGDIATANPSDEDDVLESHDLKIPQFKLLADSHTDQPPLPVSQTQQPEDSTTITSKVLSPPPSGPLSFVNIRPQRLSSKLPVNWSQLLDIHFANTHVWFPVSHKQDLLRPAYLLAHNTNIDLTNLTSGEEAFLWASLAFSSHQLEKPHGGREILLSTDIPEFTSFQLSSNAHTLLSPESRIYDIGHVRALLLLTLIQLDCGLWTSAWSLVGRAIYIAVDLGMPASPREDLSKLAGAALDEGQRRAFLGCFALDTLVSVRLGRRPYLRHYDLNSVGAVHTDGIEEWEAWRASELYLTGDVQINQQSEYTPGHVLSTFNHFVNLMGLLNDSLCVKGQSAEATNLSAIAQSYERWRALLPAHCRLPVPATAQSQFQVSIQQLNLNFASEGLNKILIENVPRGQSSRPQGSKDSTSYTQLRAVLLEHVNKFGYAWIPPTFEPYGFCCRDPIISQTLSITYTGSFNLQANQDDALTVLTGYTGNNDTALDITQQPFKTAETLFVFNPDVLSPTAPPQEPATRKAKTDTLTAYQEPHRMSQLLSNFPTNLGDAFDVDDIPASSDDNAEDNLFDRLAMLDPIDWSATQPEFMRNLGLTSTSTATQFQSLFNLDAI